VVLLGTYRKLNTLGASLGNRWGTWWDKVKVVEPHVKLFGVHPQPIHNSLPSSNGQFPGWLSILLLKVERVVYWSTAK
jgi:hypothetical protein